MLRLCGLGSSARLEELKEGLGFRVEGLDEAPMNPDKLRTSLHIV